LHSVIQNKPTQTGQNKAANLSGSSNSYKQDAAKLNDKTPDGANDSKNNICLGKR